MLKHQFIKIVDIDKPDPRYQTVKVPGVTAVCAICGETKDLFADGFVKVIVPGDPKLHDSI